MAAKNWTTKEISYIRKYALLAETNQVLNTSEMANKLGRSRKSVEMKIYNLQKDGQLPKVDRTKSFEPSNRLFTESEDKRIISMIAQNATYKEIGDSLGRTASSIEGRTKRLIQSKKIDKNSMPKRQWTKSEIDKLTSKIEFDKNGYVSNVNELSSCLNRTHHQIQTKIHRLRKDGTIKVKADRSTSSMKSKQAMNRFNDARFAQYKKKEKPAMENKAKTDLQIETQSQIVQVIMTTVIVGSEKTINFFSTDGQLLAVKKEPVSFADDTSQNINTNLATL